MKENIMKIKNKEEKTEDEIDMKAINEYEKNIKNSCVEFYNHSEVKIMLGLY